MVSYVYRREMLRATAGAIGATAGAGTVAGTNTARGNSRSTGGYEPLGFVDVEGAKEVEVSDDGRTAYVATTGGYATVDVSDPAEPVVLANREVPLPLVWDVNLDGDRLLVVGPAVRTLFGVDTKGFVLVDVSDPADPVELPIHPETETVVQFTDFPIHNCFLRDGYAYLTANWIEGNPMIVYDVRDGPPREVGRWSLLDHDPGWSEVASQLRFLHDLWVGDELACLAYWDAGTWLLDVSDPADPVAVGRAGGRPREDLAAIDDPGAIQRAATTPPGNDHSVRVAGDLMVVGQESWGVDVDGEIVGGPSGVHLWDVADPSAPEHRSSIDPPPTPDPTREGIWTTAHNFGIANDVLYTSWYRGGVKRHDVSDPSNPIQETWWRNPERASFWTAMPAVAQSGSDGFFVATDEGPDETPTGLYTFPDHPGRQTDPPGILPTPPPQRVGWDPATPLILLGVGALGLLRRYRRDEKS